MLLRPPPITLLSVLVTVDRPAVRIAQQGSNWLLMGRGAMRVNTRTRTAARNLWAHVQRALRFKASRVCARAFFIVFSFLQFRFNRFIIWFPNWPVLVAVRLRSAFWCAMLAASCRSSAASIFCVIAWLWMLATTALAVRKGADPGAAWLAPLSICAAACSVKLAAASAALSVFKLSMAKASSISVRTRSCGFAAVAAGIGPYAFP